MDASPPRWSTAFATEPIVTEPRGDATFAIRPRGLSAAIERALVNEDRRVRRTRWSDALPLPSPLQRSGGFDVRTSPTSSPPASCAFPSSRDEAFAPIQRIGGSHRLVRRQLVLAAPRPARHAQRRCRTAPWSPRDPKTCAIGDTVDFWRVEHLEDRRLLLLGSGDADSRAASGCSSKSILGEHGSLVRQTTVFDPAGYVGLAYWYVLFPVRRRVFGAMMRGIRKAMEPESSAIRPVVRLLPDDRVR